MAFAKDVARRVVLLSLFLASRGLLQSEQCNDTDTESRKVSPCEVVNRTVKREGTDAFQLDVSNTSCYNSSNERPVGCY